MLDVRGISEAFIANDYLYSLMQTRTVTHNSIHTYVSCGTIKKKTVRFVIKRMLWVRDSSNLTIGFGWSWRDKSEDWKQHRDCEQVSSVSLHHFLGGFALKRLRCITSFPIKIIYLNGYFPLHIGNWVAVLYSSNSTPTDFLLDFREQLRFHSFSIYWINLCL